MPGYRETQVAGKSWVRTGYIAINNPRPQDGTPSATYVEEEVLALGEGREVITKLGNLVEMFDPAATFDLEDPESGEVIGQMTQYQLYVAISSKYKDAARKRDATQAPVA
ncbi:hypothetical protein [Pseudomonas sp. D(2018)]|uniref:hypothetical protein n=1 Tax=Pseudomonas sp. D(2018) TaxID=2502238 RepID=UPI0010F8088E|nr:hypothetical protein [Pseudomonas sp. D(2018)]